MKHSPSRIRTTESYDIVEYQCKYENVLYLVDFESRNTFSRRSTIKSSDASSLVLAFVLHFQRNK